MHPTNVEQYVASLPPPGSTPSAGGGSPSGGFGQSTREKILHWASYGIAYEPKITYTDFIDLPASLTLAKVVADGSPGLDCVTFIELVYKAAGAPDPCGHAFSGQDSVEHTDTLLSHCTHIAQADAKAGDIVVWGSTEINVVAAGGVTGLGHHAAILLEDGPANSNNPWLASHGGNSDPVKIRFSAESAAQAGHSGIQFLRCPGL
jgi:cell wall-associated NlpC family hydrolase